MQRVPFFTEPSSAALNLQRLIAYRHWVAAGQLAAVLAASTLGFSLPVWTHVMIIVAYTTINFFTAARMRRRTQPVGERELFLHLLTDTEVLAVLLYLSGGSTYPFVSLFLRPLTLAAAALPGAYTWIMAAVTVLCYSALMEWYVPLPHQDGEHFNLHIVGMWSGFVLSAILISYFAVKMSATLREREQALAQAREDALRDDRLVALARVVALRVERLVARCSLSAGAAHELGTPLATIAVLAKVLLQECAVSPAMAEPLRVLRGQIARCKEILAKMAVSAGQVRAEAGRSHALDHYLAELLAQWHSERPGVGLRQQWQGPRPAPQIIAVETLTQAITNILNNAADASEQEVDVSGRWSEHKLYLEICDRGEGVSETVASRAGEPFFTTKAPGQGLGLGLFLAQSTIRRLGGSVYLGNRQEGGSCARIVLPLTGLTMRP